MVGKSALEIVIVEDDLVITASLEDKLIDLCYQHIAKAKSIEHALSQFTEFTPDIAIMDVSLDII